VATKATDEVLLAKRFTQLEYLTEESKGFHIYYAMLNAKGHWCFQKALEENREIETIVRTGTVDKLGRYETPHFYVEIVTSATNCE